MPVNPEGVSHDAASASFHCHIIDDAGVILNLLPQLLPSGTLYGNTIGFFSRRQMHCYIRDVGGTVVLGVRHPLRPEGQDIDIARECHRGSGRNHGKYTLFLTRRHAKHTFRPRPFAGHFIEIGLEEQGQIRAQDFKRGFHLRPGDRPFLDFAAVAIN